MRLRADGRREDGDSAEGHGAQQREAAQDPRGHSGATWTSVEECPEGRAGEHGPGECLRACGPQRARRPQEQARGDGWEESESGRPAAQEGDRNLKAEDAE